MTAAGFLYLLGILALIVASAFFSGSETALFSVNRIQLKRMETGGSGDRAANRLLRNPQRLLSTLVVGNMLVNVLFASIVASMTRDWLGERALPLAVAVSTVALLLFGEVAPKTVAVYHSQSFSRLVSLPVALLAVAFSPLRWLLQGATNAVLFLLRQKTMTTWDVVTKEEVAGMISLGEAAGVTSDRERAILDNILNFGETAADEIMMPRNEVHGVDDRATVGEAFVKACEWKHSLVPVYHDSMDDVWAIFSVVDMPAFLANGIAERPLHSFREQVEQAEGRSALKLPLYPACVFPETARLDDLLTGMKQSRVSMVVLVDEYGGTAGILSLEDLLEEVVGRLAPARESLEDDLQIAADHVMTNGRIPIRDFNRQVAAMNIPHDESDTVGGYIMELLGRLPRAGDTVDDGRLRFHVLRMAGRRIGTVRIELVAESSSDASAADRGGEA